MLGSAVIGGFILAMIEGTGILINRYSQMFMPQPAVEGKALTSTAGEYSMPSPVYLLEAPVDVDKGKVDLSLPPLFASPSGDSSSSSGHYS